MRGYRLPALAVLLAGCGRIAFDPLGDGIERGALQVTTIVDLHPTGEMPITNVPLVIADAAGVVQEVVTSPTSTTTVIVETGWSVTAVFPSDPLLARAQAQTIVGVEPGDSLRFLITEGNDTPPSSLDTMTFDTGVAASAVATPCGLFISDTQVSTVRYSDCSDPNFDLLVTAYSTTPVYGVVPVVWSAGGTLDVSMSLLPAETLDVNVTGLPQDVTSAYLGLDTYDARGVIEASQTQPSPVVAGQFTHTFAVQRAQGDARHASWTMSRMNAIEAGITGFLDIAIAETSLDVAHVAVPWIADASFDYADRALALATEGSGSYTAAVFTILGGRDARAERFIEWSVLAPEGAQRVPLPRLPAPYDDWAPAVGDSSAELRVSLHVNDLWPTYRAVRETTFSVTAGFNGSYRDFGVTRGSTASAYVIL